MAEDFELTLFDRIEMIKLVLKDRAEDEIYISYSGGKDSTVLSKLIDLALPDNKIDRVYCNTGIEFMDVVAFVKEQQKQDSRIKIITPAKNIKTTLEEIGYPFKSKLHSEYVERYQRSGTTGVSVKKYLAEGGTGKFSCPKMLRYQFTEDFNLKISQKCCLEFKKKPFKKFEKENRKTLVMTGIRGAEGGVREYQAEHGCVFKKKDGTIYKFNPISPCSNEFVEWFINKYDVKLCKLYSDPYNFTRTGCKGCPYNLHLAKELEVLEQYLPQERKQCEIIWKPVYDEYRKIGYRKMKK